MKTIPNDAQLEAIKASFANPVPAGLGYYAHSSLQDTPFSTGGFLSAYALEFAQPEAPKTRKRKGA